MDAQYRTGESGLGPGDWNAGDRGWIVDFVAPFGDAAAMARDLRTNVFPGRTGNSFRVRSGRPGAGIRVMRGGPGVRG